MPPPAGTKEAAAARPPKGDRAAEPLAAGASRLPVDFNPEDMAEKERRTGRPGRSMIKPQGLPRNDVRYWIWELIQFDNAISHNIVPAEKSDRTTKWIPLVRNR